jgi:hypothetical protein
MSFFKKKRIDDVALRQGAFEILVVAGTLRECEHHKGSFLQGTCDLAAAFTLANYQLTKETFGPATPELRRGLMDAIKKAYGENMFFDRCERCHDPKG